MLTSIMHAAAEHDFDVLLKSGKTIRVERANAYQPEGPMTTFFVTGSSRLAIDSWSTRVASYRTADIVAIQRCPEAAASRPALEGVIDLTQELELAAA